MGEREKRIGLTLKMGKKIYWMKIEKNGRTSIMNASPKSLEITKDKKPSLFHLRDSIPPNSSHSQENL